MEIEINKELIKHVAKLARLKLSDNEIKKFLPQFKEILEAFSKIDEVDTTDIKASFQPVEIKNVTRVDEIKKSLSTKEALSLTSHKKGAYFKGPKIV